MSRRKARRAVEPFALPRRKRLNPRAVTLLGLFMMLLGVGLAGWWAWPRAVHAWLLARGATVEGRVLTRVSERPAKGSPTYRLRIHYEVPAGTFEKELAVDQAAYRSGAGDRIAVRYLASDPSVATVAGTVAAGPSELLGAGSCFVSGVFLCLLARYALRPPPEGV